MAVSLSYSFVPGPGIDGLAEAAMDLTPLMDQIGALLEQSTRDRIESTNVSPDGVPWPPSLRAEEDGGPTLYQSGALAASITHQAGPDEAQIGSGMIYAGVHQTGAEILPVNGKALQFQLPNGSFATVGKVTIPARPYLGVSEDDALGIEELTQAYFAESLE